MFFGRIFGRRPAHIQSSPFSARVEELLKRGRPEIAFGLRAIDEDLLRSLEDVRRYAEIILVGPPEIQMPHTRRFRVIIDSAPEERMAKLLAADEVAGIIRGTLDDDKTTFAYEKLTGERYKTGPALFEDPMGRHFFMTPLDCDRGWTKQERLDEVRELINFVKEWGVRPSVAVYSAVRAIHPQQARTAQISGMLNKTFEDAEWIVGELINSNEEIVAKNFAIDLDKGVREGFNIHLLVNGMVGNQILRTFLFCGGRIFGATRLGLSRFWEDNSKNEKDYRLHVRWLVASINKKHNA